MDVLLDAAKGLGYPHLEDPPVVHHDVNAYVTYSVITECNNIDTSSPTHSPSYICAVDACVQEQYTAR